MQDPEQEYPPRQLKSNGYRHSLNGTPLPARSSVPNQEPPQQAEEEEEEHAPQLPTRRLPIALIAGVIIGLVCIGQVVLITFANSSVYQRASATLPAKLTVSLALALVGLRVLTSLISAVIYLIGGFITGRIVVQRRLGFLAGFVAGVITYGAGFLLSYIPNYPGNLPTSRGTGNVAEIAGAIAISLVSLLIAGGFAGLISLFGAWLATRRHRYYER